MTTGRVQHMELLLAAITAEAAAERLDDTAFRQYVLDITENTDLPRRLTVVPNPDEAA